MPDPCLLPSDKPELRRMMEMRRSEAALQNKKAPLALRDHFLKSIALPPHSIISSYRARGSEMDPSPLAEALRATGHAIALPVMMGRNNPLVFRIHNVGDALRPNAYGIEEPGEGASIVNPDILLVPLLAFDRQGGRLGAGGGYYDRTIKELRERRRVLAVGVGFSCQEISSVPVGPHDMRLDRIATETQAF